MGSVLEIICFGSTYSEILVDLAVNIYNIVIFDYQYGQFQNFKLSK